MEHKESQRKRNRLTDPGLRLNDIFKFKGGTYRISYLSEIGVRAERLNQKVTDAPLQTLYWFGVEHFEKETNFKINTEGGFPVQIEPHRYVASPEGLGEIVEVRNEGVKVRLFKSEGKRGRRKTIIFTREELKSLSQHQPQLSNTGSYIKGIDIIVIPYSEEIETRASIEIVQDTQDGKWRYGIEYRLPNTHGGIQGPSKFYSRMFDDRRKAIKAAVRYLKDIMRKDLPRAETTLEQRQKINKAIEETDKWLSQKAF
jgi:hypothetical protein